MKGGDGADPADQHRSHHHHGHRAFLVAEPSSEQHD
jgi:hypothetical protein